ncbi:MAG: ATP synthase F0 subunit B [Desulfobacteraceae bacterium]|nr:ATP synthase F0 subunit B [Desulfobacteraceae bacterium]
MKVIKSVMKSGATVFVLVCGGLVSEAFADGGFEFSRATYDLIMMWVNFIILAAIIVKYSRRPIKNFLKQQKNEIVDTIKELEEQKKQALEKIQKSKQELETSQKNLEIIKNKIVSLGQQRKEELIQEAENESRVLLEIAQFKIQAYIREAAEQVKLEMIETASEMAAEKLPSILKKKDYDRCIHSWLEAAT